MNISKISRSIIVVIFVVFIIFLSFLNISNMINKGGDVTNSVTSTLIKVGFVFAVVFLVIIYMYIKDKLYKLHIKRKLSFIYRYIYIILVLLGACIFSSKNRISSFSDNKMIFYVFITLLTCFLIKKIIFNVSKSDILSVLGMFTYALFPNIIIVTDMYMYSMMFTAIFLAAIFVFQVLIDELKQKGIKTKKYIIETIIFALLAGASTLCGMSIWAWVIIILLTLAITYNLDNTHISFPKKLMSSLTQAKRESLYKIERININKIIVVIILSIVILFAINIIFSNIILKLSNNNTEIVVQQLSNNKISSANINLKSLAKQVIFDTKVFVSCAPMFYIVVFIYILFMESLAFFLHRKYDTKSTIMKAILLILILTISAYNLNMLYFQPLLTILLILISIVNTSNIYLNREERIKMLVA